jgi:hypothetical protein
MSSSVRWWATKKWPRLVGRVSQPYQRFGQIALGGQDGDGDADPSRFRRPTHDGVEQIDVDRIDGQ